MVEGEVAVSADSTDAGKGLFVGPGKEKWKVAPRVGLFVAQMDPPCTSMIDFETESPIPIPAGLVV